MELVQELPPHFLSTENMLIQSAIRRNAQVAQVAY